MFHSRTIGPIELLCAPKSDRAPGAAGGNPFAVRTENDLKDRPFLILKPDRLFLLRLIHIPQHEMVVIARRNQQFVIRAEGYRLDLHVLGRTACRS